MTKTKKITWRYFAMGLIDILFLILKAIKVIFQKVIKVIFKKILKWVLEIIFMGLEVIVRKIFPYMKKKIMKVMETKKGQLVLGFSIAVSILTVYGIIHQGPLTWEISDALFLTVAFFILVFIYGVIEKPCFVFGTALGFSLALTVGQQIAHLF